MKALAALLVLAATLTAAPAQAQPTVATGQCHTAAVEWPRGVVLFVAAADGTDCEIAMSVDCERRRAGSARMWPIHRTGWLDDGQLDVWRIRCGRRADAIGHRIDGFPIGGR
jgi:hypothetical protein